MTLHPYARRTLEQRLMELRGLAQQSRFEITRLERELTDRRIAHAAIENNIAALTRTLEPQLVPLADTARS